MMIDAESLAGGSELAAEALVVGAGAAGIVLALELARAGIDVVLVESGQEKYSARVQALADAAAFEGATHPPMDECTRRQVGGTSVIWGGRVVPFDPVDFDERPHLPHSRWPIGYADVASYYARTCAYMRAGEPRFSTADLPGVTQRSLVPGLPDGDVLTSTLERWSVIDYGVEFGAELRRSPRIRLVHGLTCTEIETAQRPGGGDRVTGIVGRTLGGKTVRLSAKRYVLASGGLNTTRLLMCSDKRHAGGIGNHSGLLGRFYTGHITGRIAEVRFATPAGQTVYGFDRDAEGVYARRRFSFSREAQHRERLANVVAWLVNPEIGDAGHGNGVLSFAYLALASPLGKHFASEAIRKAAIKGKTSGVGAHVMNMLRDGPRTAVFIPTFGYRRFLAKRKVPGFFQYSRSNTYTLHYASEQAPNPDSRVTLSEERDELGMRRIRIDHRYSVRDVENVLAAHRLWDGHLRAHGCGRLEYIEKDLEKSVWDQAGDGFHQVGTARMSARPEDGVVNPDGCVHGFDDLYLAGSATFVTASQANSMFMIIVSALRVAEHLARRSREGR